MLRKTSIGLLFILVMLAGSLIYFFSARLTSAEQPYQIALSRGKVNVIIRELEARIDGRIKLLEVEVEKLQQESAALQENLTVYETETGKELSELRKLLEAGPAGN